MQIGRKWGYIDKTGKVVIAPQFDKAGDFSEGLAAVEVEEKWSYINRQGEFAIRTDFYNAWPFVNGLAPVMLEPSRQYAIPEGTVIENVGNKWGYIDKTGKVIIKVEGLTDGIGDFIDGIAKIEFKDERIGYIDRTGRYIWGPTKSR